MTESLGSRQVTIESKNPGYFPLFNFTRELQEPLTARKTNSRVTGRIGICSMIPGCNHRIEIHCAKSWSGDVAQWQSTCFACMRPRVQSPASPYFGLPTWLSGKESACQCRGCTRCRFDLLAQEDPLEQETATHSIILIWKIPSAEEPGRLQSMGSQGVGHD